MALTYKGTAMELSTPMSIDDGPVYNNLPHPIRGTQQQANQAGNMVNSWKSMRQPSAMHSVQTQKPVFISLSQFTSRAACLKDYQAKEILGAGVNGTVFNACSEAGCNFVVKVMKAVPKDKPFSGLEEFNNMPPGIFKGLFGSSFEHEAADSKKAGKLEISPKIIDSWTCPGTSKEGKAITLGFIVMQKVTGITMRKWLTQIDTALKNNIPYYAHYLQSNPAAVNQNLDFRMFKEKFGEILSKLDRILKVCHGAGLYHHDLHDENVMLLQPGLTPILIDWGFRRVPNHAAYDYQRIAHIIERRMGATNSTGGRDILQNLHPQLYNNPFYQSYLRIGPDMDRDPSQRA